MFVDEAVAAGRFHDLQVTSLSWGWFLGGLRCLLVERAM
ncbi:MAG: hypothetical protein ACI8Y4_005528 [Candidatus Poriferisodalaceae bacterium]